MKVICARKRRVRLQQIGLITAVIGLLSALAGLASNIVLILRK